MPACIYCIKNNLNGHCYIGQTLNHSARFSKHLTALRKGNHCNTHLQRAYNKYGENAFSFFVIETVDNYNIIGERERYWIDKLGYYNIDKGRNGFTPTALRNMSEAHIGQISKKRKIDNNTALKICAITSFCDGSVRKLATLTNLSRDIIKNIAVKKTYKDCWEQYNKLTFPEQLLLCKTAIDIWKYDFWAETNCPCPKKNAYIYFLIKKSNYNYKMVEQLIPMTAGNIRRIKNEVESGKREIDTTYNDEQLKQIVAQFCRKPMPWEAANAEPVETR